MYTAWGGLARSAREIIFKHRRCWPLALALVVPADIAVAAPPDWTIARADLVQDGNAVRITYRDGRSAVVTKKRKGIYDRPVDAFEAPVISADHKSVGWSISEYADASYPVDADLDVYRYGKQSPGFDGGSGMAQSWRFWAGGKQVVVEFAFPHGLPFEHVGLFDVATGKQLGMVDVHNDTGKTPASAPAWAK